MPTLPGRQASLTSRNFWFVLVDMDARRVEVFRRQPGNEWLMHDYAGEPACHFESVKLTLDMETVFEDVDAPAAEA